MESFLLHSCIPTHSPLLSNHYSASSLTSTSGFSSYYTPAYCKLSDSALKGLIYSLAYCKQRADPTHIKAAAARSELEMAQPLSLGTPDIKPLDLNGSLHENDHKTVTPGLLSITIPQQSVAKFRESYEGEALKWPSDLPTTTDFHKIEQFVSSAHSLVRKYLPQDLITRLEGFIHDPSQPSALVIRGLPIDSQLPPSTPQGRLQKDLNKQLMSEVWLVGIARIIGQPFIYDYLAKIGGSQGMALLIRELYPTPQSEKEVSALGSKEFLDVHMDFFHLVPHCYPNCIVFMGIRGDPSMRAKTLLCDYRELFAQIDPAMVHILRTEKITWQGSQGGFSKFIVEGSDDNPLINIFDENVGQSGGFDKMVRGSPMAIEAYKHVKEVARKVAMRGGGVWLDGGDVLVLNQRRSAHGRTSFTARYDGTDRWMQRIYVNEGVIWKPVGLVPWPQRTLPLEVADKGEP